MILGQLVDLLGAPEAVQVELLRGDVCIQRVDPDAERQLSLELRRRAGEHEEAVRLGAAAQRAEQVCLADARAPRRR